MNKFQQNLFSILGATAIVVVQSSVAIALSPDAINQIGREIAVRIDGQNSGTGAIVSREGNTYTVITNWHVVNSDGAYSIQTFDGQSYAVDYRQVKQLVGSDLALVSFTSDRDYNVPEIGNSDDLKEGQNVYIAGYPGSQSVASDRSYRFYPESLIGFLSPSNIQDGYELIYSGDAQPGMSGSPILNDNGQLIGIYGLVDFNSTGSQTLYGIPVNTAAKLAARVNVNLRQSINSSTNSSTAPISELSSLVGTWQADVVEFGYQLRIVLHLNSDSTYYTRWYLPNGTYKESSGNWNYANNILYQRSTLSSANVTSYGKGSIKWIENNHFQLTILDNGTPAYTGIQRNYYRQ